MIKKNTKKRILVAPLNWGIGHASRMIPIIEELSRQGTEVIVAAEGFPLALLKNRFPTLEHLEFTGFRIQYSKQKEFFAAKMFVQLPKIIWGIYKEHKKLKRIIRSKSIDAVISDNRYGLFSKQIPCVFVTHQMFIQIPQSIQFLSPILNLINTFIISHYQELWIPDFKSEFNLSGDLSHQKELPTAKYLGALSRFNSLANKEQSKEQEIDVLVSLSGPEPQRSLLERKIIHQLLNTDYTAVILQGKPGQKKQDNPSSNITLLPHLSDVEFVSYLNNSRLFISRSGYSTIMDLYILGKKASFIPTPGQTEQEYLAERLKNKKICNSLHQNEFEIEKAFSENDNYFGFKSNATVFPYPKVIANFLKTLK